VLPFADVAFVFDNLGHALGGGGVLIMLELISDVFSPCVVYASDIQPFVVVVVVVVVVHIAPDIISL
jgi:hypothetical protein